MQNSRSESDAFRSALGGGECRTWAWLLVEKVTALWSGLPENVDKCDLYFYHIHAYHSIQIKSAKRIGDICSSCANVNVKFWLFIIKYNAGLSRGVHDLVTTTLGIETFYKIALNNWV